MISRLMINHTAMHIPNYHKCSLIYGVDIPFSNNERVIIFEMRDKYAKLNFDSDWNSAIESYEEEIEKGKIQYNFLISKKLELNERIRKLRTRSEVTTTNDGEKSILYLLHRYEEICSRTSAISSRINSCQTEFYGFLYLPLIDCVKKLKKIHQECDSKNCFCKRTMCYNGVWDLSKMLLTIFNTSELTVGNYDNFSLWNRNNIFCHPLVSIIDNHIDSMIGIIDTTNSPEIILEEIELAYYKVVVKKLIRFFIKHEKKINPKILKIMSINSTGFIIYSYVIGTNLLIQVLADLGVYFFEKEKKRKLNY